MAVPNISHVVFILVVQAVVRNDGSTIDGCQGDTCDKELLLQRWLQEILAGINTLPRLKSPGRLITFGEQAFPIILGSSDEDQLMAVATHGAGRVAAIRRHEYLNDFIGQNDDPDIACLHQNLKRWLSGGSCESDACICQPVDSDQLSSCLGDSNVKILLWAGGDWPNGRQNTKVNNWVMDGGALIHGFTSRLWDKEGVKSAVNLGFYKAIWKAGIVYSPNGFNSPDDIPVSSDEAMASQLVSLNFLEVCKALTFENVASNRMVEEVRQVVSSDQHYFPKYIAQALLAPLETFAIAQETNMIWPAASPTNRKEEILATSEHQYMFKVYHLLAMAHLWEKKAPSVDLWPGNLKNSPNTTTGTFTFESKVKVEYYSTGMYLLPGRTLSVEILNDAQDLSWQKFELMIGSHTDNLQKLSMLRRWPQVDRCVALYDTTFSVRWMFGGLVYVKASAGVGRTLKIKLSGAIATPYLNLEDPASITAWEISRQSQGLVADMRGTKVWFTIPAHVVQNYDADYLCEVLQKFDSAVEKAYDLYAFPENERRRQWVTGDIQISKGVLHSGYPICSYIKDPTDPESLTHFFDGDWENRWGVFHEIGHNLANDKWMWKGNAEVVNNVVGLLNIERLTSLHEWPIPKIQRNIDACLSNFLESPTFPAEQKCGLLVYSQLIRDFGFDCLNTVFKGLWADEESGTYMSVDDNHVINQWVLRYSQAVNHNLVPLFGDFWQWPITNETRNTLSSLPPFIPDDIITQDSEALGLISAVLSQYPDILRQPLPVTCPEFDMWYWN